MKTDHILRQVTQYWTGSGIHTTHAIKIWTDTRQMTARFGITTNRCQIWGELCSGPIFSTRFYHYVVTTYFPICQLYYVLCNKHHAAD